MRDDYVDIESLDWYWANAYVEELIDKLDVLFNTYDEDYRDLRIDMREVSTQRGLIQQAMLEGIQRTVFV